MQSGNFYPKRGHQNLGNVERLILKRTIGWFGSLPLYAHRCVEPAHPRYVPTLDPSVVNEKF